MDKRYQVFVSSKDDDLQHVNLAHLAKGDK